MFAIVLRVTNTYFRFCGVPHALVILCYSFDIFPKILLFYIVSVKGTFLLITLSFLITEMVA
jgi:hypothetical protein